MEGLGEGFAAVYKLMIAMILPAIVGLITIIWFIVRGVMWLIQHVQVV